MTRTWVALTLFAASVLGQQTINVLVGKGGSSFSPKLLAAQEGDIIHFTFLTLDTHTVTQSTFDDPCTPLQGGFSSGKAGYNGSTTISNTEAPTWDLTITNVSEPIWFYCQILMPTPHCHQGMVGVINGLPEDFADVEQRAKAMTNIPTPMPTTALTGIGAFATALPSAAQANSPTTTTSETPTTSSTIIDAPPTTSESAESQNSGSSNSNAAAIGGGIGGAILAVCLLIFVYLIMRHRRKQKAVPYPMEASERGENMGGGYIFPHAKGSMAQTPTTAMFSPTSDGRSQIVDLRRGYGPTNFNTMVMDQPDSPPANAHAHSPSYTYSQPSDGGGEAARERGYASSDAQALRVSESHSPPPPPPVPEVPPPRHTSTRSEVNYHEIAKEVATLLGPQLRAAQSQSQSPPPEHPELHRPRPSRQLPNPIDYGPRSPGPPQYEQ